MLILALFNIYVLVSVCLTSGVTLLQILHSGSVNKNVYKALIVAEYVGVEIKIVDNFQMGVSNKTPEFLKMNPIGKVYCLGFIIWSTCTKCITFAPYWCRFLFLKLLMGLYSRVMRLLDTVSDKKIFLYDFLLFWWWYLVCSFGCYSCPWKFPLWVFTNRICKFMFLFFFCYEWVIIFCKLSLFFFYLNALQGQIEQWIDFSSFEIDANLRAWVIPRMGYSAYFKPVSYFLFCTLC